MVCLSECPPASNPGQAHADPLVLTQPQLHVVAVHTAGGPLLADAPLAGLAQVRVTLPICTQATDTPKLMLLTTVHFGMTVNTIL